MVEKLKDLLKEVDPATRRCIVALNNKMDDQFKRMMSLKTAPQKTPEPVNVAELRAEVKNAVTEVKEYVKSRDKANKEAIKQIDDKVERYLAPVESTAIPMNIPESPNKIGLIEHQKRLHASKYKPYREMLQEITEKIWGEKWSKNQPEIVMLLWDLQETLVTMEAGYKDKNIDLVSACVNNLEEKFRRVKREWVKSSMTIQDRGIAP